MDKIITKPKRRADSERLLKQELFSFVLAGLSFFFGRIIIFGSINPLVMAYLTTFLLSGNKFYAAALFGIGGLLTVLSPFAATKYIIAVMLLAVVNLLFSKRLSIVGDIAPAVVSGAAVGLSGLFFAFTGGSALYMAMIACMEAVLCFSLSLILSRSVQLTKSAGHMQRLSGEELISILLLCCGLITGMADINIANVTLRYFATAFMIILFAYRGGSQIGATAGVLIGVLMYFTGREGLEFIVVMSVSGFCAGVFAGQQRFFPAIAFTVSSVFFAYIFSGRMVDIYYLISLFFSTILFLLVPEKLMDLLANSLKPSIDNSTLYHERIKAGSVSRLKNLARSFERLSRSYGRAGDEKAPQTEVAELIDEACQSACRGCAKYTECWRDGFYASFQNSLGFLRAWDIGDEPDTVYAGCAYPGRYSQALRRLYDNAKAEDTWNRRLAETRSLVAGQMSGVAAILNRLSVELDIENGFDEELERKLHNELIKNKISVNSISVVKNKHNLYEVSVLMEPCGERRACSKKIVPLVNSVLGVRMKKADSDCLITSKNGKAGCVLNLIEQSRLEVKTGLARAAKDTSDESGDTQAVIESASGVILVLSDGMGSGKRARADSETAVGLLESFVESGFDNETAIKMINSALLLRSRDDCFSTLDICALNLYEGSAEFIKIGAAPAYLLRRGSVSAVKSNTLPAGIMASIDVEPIKRKIKAGDVILMMSDGVSECGEEAGWIAEKLRGLAAMPPQAIAREILDEAKGRAGAVRDDMTVLVAEVY